jgi:hypothetical protein
MESIKPKDDKEKAAGTHPEASEDIQLNIETVTPDTEKEGLANEDKEKSGSETQDPSGTES